MTVKKASSWASSPRQVNSLCAGVSLIFLVAYLLIRSRGLYSDEPAHYEQIRRFVAGDKTLVRSLTTIPGYHYLLASLSKLCTFSHVCSINSLASFRLITCLFGLAAAVPFYLSSCTFDRGSPLIKTLSFVLLPCLFTYMFVIYTDVLSILLLVLAFYFARIQRFGWSGVMAALTLLVRQNLVVWLPFIPALEYVEAHGLALSLPGLKNIARRYWTYSLGLGGFVFFVLWNHGVALGDKESQYLGLHFGNAVMFCFLYLVIFLPTIPFSLANIRRWRVKQAACSLALLAALAAATFHSINEPHHYNLIPTFIRNDWLIYASGSLEHRILYAGLACLGLLSLCAEYAEDRAVWVLGLFFLASTLPAHLVEHRYLIPSFMFLILLRTIRSTKVEWALVLWQAVLTGYTFLGVVQGKFNL